MSYIKVQVPVCAKIKPSPETEAAFVKEFGRRAVVQNYFPTLDIPSEKVRYYKQMDEWIKMPTLSFLVDYNGLCTIDELILPQLSSAVASHFDQIYQAFSFYAGQGLSDFFFEVIDSLVKLYESAIATKERAAMAELLFGSDADEKQLLNPSHTINQLRNNWFGRIVKDMIIPTLPSYEKICAIECVKPKFFYEMQSIVNDKAGISTLSGLILATDEWHDYVLFSLASQIVANVDSTGRNIENILGRVAKYDLKEHIPALVEMKALVEAKKDHFKALGKQEKEKAEDAYQRRATELAAQDLRLKLSIQHGYDSREAFIAAEQRIITQKLKSLLESALGRAIGDESVTIEVLWDHDCFEHPHERLAFDAESFSDSTSPSLEALVIKDTLLSALSNPDGRNECGCQHNLPVQCHIFITTTPEDLQSYHPDRGCYAEEVVWVSSLMPIYPKLNQDSLLIKIYRQGKVVMGAMR